MQQHTIATPYMVGDVHCYTIEIEGELVLFDTGPSTEAAQGDLRRAVDLHRLKYLFVTHCHVDHYGLIDFVARNSEARIFIPHMDAIKVQRHEERLERIADLLAACGYDHDFSRSFRSGLEVHRLFPTVPLRYEVVEESDVPARLGISWLNCPGHSQSDLVYRYGEHAVTGDILLRDIFQVPLLDVDLTTFDGRFRNYEAYCASLHKLAGLRGCIIHPGHRLTVESLDATILFYAGKLLERARAVHRLAHLERERDVVEALFGATLREPFFIYLKVAEIVFMRDFLADPERLKRSLETIGLFAPLSKSYAAVFA
ncbi:MAG: MBL fold metallo-hydrolase [Desulfuromonadales bacterium]|nr:MBL fold metallo-hydrolase [Desulfuromonadales bacterium]